MMHYQFTRNIGRFLSYVACVLMLLVGITTFAQNTGTISGTVRDSAGKVIVGAKVNVYDLQHNSVVRALTTTSSGTYAAFDLITSDYRVSAEMDGFSKATVDHIALHIHDELAIDLTLKVGNVQETVTVEAPTVEIETASSSGSTLVNATQVIDLPLNTRNFTQLTGIQPGVSSSGGAGGVSISVNGQRSTANGWTTDGGDTVSRGANTSILIQPSIDSIAEFKTQRNTYSAEYGHNASGQVDVVTKSGTSTFHGSAYEFFRNDVLDGNNYFNNLVGAARPPLRYNDFGYTLGGPIMIPHTYNQKKDKSFFFFSQEFNRIVNFGTSSLSGDPTELELKGVFPNGTQLSKLNSTAQAYVKDVFSKIPRPNNPSDANGLIFTSRDYQAPHQEILRIDHTLTPNISAFFKFENDSKSDDNPGGGFPGVNNHRDYGSGRQMVARATWIKSPTLLFDVSYAYTRGISHQTPVGYMSTSVSTDVIPTMTLPYTSTLGRLPEISFDGGTSLDTNGPYNNYDYMHSVAINVSKLLGRHSLRAGVVYYYYRKTENVASYNEGEFDFTNSVITSSCKKSSASFELSFCNFLTGSATQFIQLSKDSIANVITNQPEAYIQDNWTVTPRLTINAGIRYSWPQPPFSGNHELTNFYPQSYNSAYAPTMNTVDGFAGTLCITGGIYCDSGKSPNSNYSKTNGIIIGDNNSPWNSRVSPQPWHDFAPRVGFSFDVFGDGKTALRGGYGLVYDTTLYGTYEQSILANPPYAQLAIMETTAYGVTSFSNPSSGTNYGLIPRPLYATSTQTSIPYAQQFSLGVEQQLAKNLIAKLSYVGSTGTHLIGAVDLNQPKPGAYISAGIAKADGITSSNTIALNLVRPYIGYTAIDAVVPWFTSNYHSLQSQLQKRFADSSLIDLNYTWSRNMTTNQSDRDAGIQNLYDMRADYGRAAFDRRHIFSADFVYTLPMYRNAHDWQAIAAKNWQVGGMVYANSGPPATPHYYFNSSTLASADPAGLGLLDSDSSAHAMMRPDQISNPNSGAPHTRTKWFNTDAYANIPAGQIRPGNATVGGINAPGSFRVDLAIYKSFDLPKTAKLQFRAEATNVFNHTNFGGIQTSALSNSFGQVTSAGDPRIMQLSGRISF
ncbi:MAG: carboxypeptidase-like regulatory domain-containing protein [Terracidiphilus sp.]|nr:carboxypeptidase-like regulatory domain-containing protein [Terracidiphilus sp.]